MPRNQLSRRPLAMPFMSTFAREVDQLQNSINRMFENPLAVATSPFGADESVAWFPAVEIADSGDLLTMTVELPGLDPKDVQIDLDGDILTLSGEKRSERKEEGTNKDYYLEERSYGAFQRSFTLPPTVDGNAINATFDKGVLTLKLPKSKEAKVRGRRIPIAEK